MKPCRPDCQCPNCDPEMAAIMRMTPEQHSGWLRLNAAKVQQQRVFRMAAPSSQIPDPYAPGIATRRAAEATPASAFAERYKAERLAALQAEYAAHDAWRAAHPAPRPMTAEELAPYAAPDPYREGIKALQAKALKEAR